MFIRFFVVLFVLQSLMQMPPVIFDIIAPSPVYAQITEDCKIYSTKELNFAIADVSAGGFVEILQDFSYEVYMIKIDEGLTGWVSAKFLCIPPDGPTDESVVSTLHLEKFINDGGYKSESDYLLLADIGRQKLHVFKGSVGKWQFKRSFDCSTGTNTSPTTRGVFTVSDRGKWFFSERLNSGAKFWLRFNGNYLFHSVPMDKDKKIIPGEDVLGQKRSSGCIRLSVEDAKWLYENVPSGTAVVIV